MTEEEYLRKRMEMINQNSVYGLVGMMTNSEIAKIIHDDIERDTSNVYDRFNSPPPPIPIRPVKVKTLKEKIDNYKRRKKEMKATSTQVIKNVKDISFTIVNDPIEIESKLTIVASTDDDIFAFEFEGPDMLQNCKKSGLFTGWEKDQMIKELEKENKQNKETADTWSEAYYNLSKKFDELNKKKDQKISDLIEEYEDLQHKYNLEREANEAQHKFFSEYAGKGTEIEFNYAIGDTDETTYVIIDKEEYKALKNIQNNVRLHGMEFTPDELVNRIKELEALKTPTIENFTDEKPSKYHNPCGHCVHAYVNVDDEPCLSCFNGDKFEEHSDQPKSDNVNHPSHYETGKFECIEVMQEIFGVDAVRDFCKCNTFKYIYRMDRKNGEEDVKKAIWYLNKYLELTEKEV